MTPLSAPISSPVLPAGSSRRARIRRNLACFRTERRKRARAPLGVLAAHGAAVTGRSGTGVGSFKCPSVT